MHCMYVCYTENFLRVIVLKRKTKHIKETVMVMRFL